MNGGFVFRGYSCLFDLILPAMTAKSMLTLLAFYFCNVQAKLNKYRVYSDLVINLIIFSVAKNNIKHIVYFCNFKVT